MDLIEKPASMAERIVNAVCKDIYGRSGGDAFFDGMDEDVKTEELIPGLVAVVEMELERRIDLPDFTSAADDVPRFFFTFGQGHANANYYVELHGTEEETRKRIVEMFGLKWSMQYSAANFIGRVSTLERLRLPYSLLYPSERT